MNNMETIIKKLKREKLNKTTIKQAGSILKKGGLVAFPTETVYGLGADALNEKSIYAVHAAMAGKTKLVIGLVHDKFVHLPIKAVTAHRNAVDPEGSLWRDALDATGQPVLMVNDLEAAHAKMAAAVAGAKSKPSEQKKSK